MGGWMRMDFGSTMQKSDPSIKMTWVGRASRSIPRAGAMTFVELLMAIGLLALLSTVIVARLGTGSIGGPGARAVARRLALDLRHARSLAIAEGTNHYVLFDGEPSSLVGYTIYRAASPDGIPVESYRVIDYGLAASGSTTRAEFTPTGAALGAYTFTISGGSESIVVAVIAATGTTTVEAL